MAKKRARRVLGQLGVKSNPYGTRAKPLTPEERAKLKRSSSLSKWATSILQKDKKHRAAQRAAAAKRRNQ